MGENWNDFSVCRISRKVSSVSVMFNFGKLCTYKIVAPLLEFFLCFQISGADPVAQKQAK